ncbi:YciI family protein [Niveibacterium terrae]|uniref:YciI family protein n=1 Tax=Niveibacterium terrae TaxID=3373598 RepID=UPI003A93D1C4
MYVVLLTYTQPLSAIEEALLPHREYLARHFATDTFLLAGPQQPRKGGVILVRASSRAEVEALIAEDPFHQKGLAEYQIIEFVARATSPALAAFAEGA